MIYDDNTWWIVIEHVTMGMDNLEYCTKLIPRIPTVIPGLGHAVRSL